MTESSWYLLFSLILLSIMSHLTEKDLNHLAKLCRLELSVADKEKLLPQLDNIIAFVSQLQQCDTSDVKNITSVEQYTPLRE